MKKSMNSPPVKKIMIVGLPNAGKSQVFNNLTGEMHRLDGLQVRPRATVKLHQQYPCYGIECEGAHIALDEAIVSHISVWSGNGRSEQGEEEPRERDKKHRTWWGGFLEVIGERIRRGFER